MNQIKIAVTIPLKDAVAAGSARYGDADVTLTDDDIRAMPDEVRQLIANARPARLRLPGLLLAPVGTYYSSYGYTPTLEVPTATVPALVDALTKVAAAIKAERDQLAVAAEQKRVQDELAVAKALSEPLEAWIAYRDLYSSEPVVRRTLHDAPSDDPRIEARRQEAERTVVASAKAAWAAKQEAEKRAKVEADAEKMRLQGVADAETRDWIVASGEKYGLAPEVVRAAREGRQVRATLTAAVNDWMRQQLQSVTGLDEDDFVTSYREVPREDVPTREAYRLLDVLTASHDVLVRAARLPNAIVTIGPIARHDINPMGSQVWRTGIRVQLEHPWLTDEGSCEWTLLTEPKDAGDGDD